MTDKLLIALAAKDEHEALRKIAEASDFMTAVSEATGHETYSEALEAIRNSVSLSREVTTITEKTESAQALGTLLAWKSAHTELPKQQARVTELEEEGRKRDVAALIAEGLKPNAPENKHGGKLTPASAKYWENEPATKLEAFLAVAPRVIPGEAKQANSEVQTNASGAAADADGNAWENIKPAKRAAMKKDDPELYDALRNDWLRRGSPAPERK